MATPLAPKQTPTSGPLGELIERCLERGLLDGWEETGDGVLVFACGHVRYRIRGRDEIERFLETILRDGTRPCDS